MGAGVRHEGLDERQARVFDRRPHPLPFDLVEDRVRSRALTVSTFLLLFSVLAVVVLGPSLRDPYNRQTATQGVDTVDIVSQPASVAASGRALGFQPVVRAQSYLGDAVEATTVTASALPQDVTWTPLLMTPVVPLSGWAVKYATLGMPVLSGDVAQATSATGSAFFSDLTLTGQPSEVTLQFSAGDDALASTVVKFTSDVSNTFSFGETDPFNSVERVLEPLSVQPDLLLVDSNGDPIEGRYCRVVGSPFSLPGSMLWDKNALFSTDVLGPSDADGRIQTTDFAIVGFDDPWVLPAVNCEGNFELLGTVVVTSDVAAVEFETPPPSAVVEGARFDEPVSVRVTDAAGAPVAGRLAIAHMSLDNGMPYTLEAYEPIDDLEGGQHGDDGCLTCRKRGTYISKRLQNIYSAESDADGVATFEDLRFSAEGPAGTFRVRVYVDGVATPETGDIEVATSVATLHAFDTTGIEVLFDHCPDDGQSSCVGRTEQVPYIFVGDADGNALSGKTAEVAPVLGSQEVPAAWVYDGLYSTTAGLLYINGLYMARGGNDSYELDVTVDGVLAATLSITVTNLQNTSSEVPTHLENLGVDEWPTAQVASTISPQPILRATNSWGNPVEGAWVLGQASKSMGLTEQPVAQTDADGVANFTSVGDLLSMGGGNTLWFSCVTNDWDPVAVSDPMDMNLLQPITGLALEAMAVNATPGELLDPQPVVRVDGLEPGTNVTASITIVDYPWYMRDLPWAASGEFNCNSFTSNPQGTLCQPDLAWFFFGDSQISATVAADGTIAWPELSVRPGIVGQLLFGFYVDGYIDALTKLDVAQSVGGLELLQEPVPAGLVGFAFEEEPVLRVVDAHSGDGLEGYSVYITAVDPDSLEPLDDLLVATYATYDTPYSTSGVYMTASAQSDADGVVVFQYSHVNWQTAQERSFRLSFSLAEELVGEGGAAVYSNATFTTTQIIESVTVSTAPSAQATFDAVMPTQPVVDVVLAEAAGNVSVEDLVVTPVLTGWPSDVAASVTWLGLDDGDGAVNANGRAYFAGLEVLVETNPFGASNADVAAGDYELQFDVLGVRSAAAAVSVLNTPSQVTLLQQPPETATVLLLFERAVEVQLTLGNGSPLVGMTVRASIVDQPEDSSARLDESSAEAVTDDRGVASLLLRLTAGLPGNYTFEFASEGGFTSLVSDVVAVSNAVADVALVSAPAEATVGVPLSQSVVARVRRASGEPIENIQVQLGFEDWVNLRVADADSLVATADADGLATFSGVEFVQGSTDDYRLLVEAAGVRSASATLAVTNLYEYDTSALDSWSTFMYCVAVLGLPLFAGNAEGWANVRFERAWGLFGVAWSALFVAFAATQMALFAEYVDEVYDYPDPFALLANLVLLLCAVAVFALFGWYVVGPGSRGPSLHERKVARSDALVRRLLPIGASVRRSLRIKRAATLAVAEGVRCINLEPHRYTEVAERVAAELVRSYEGASASDSDKLGGAEYDSVVQEVMRTFEELKSEFAANVSKVTFVQDESPTIKPAAGAAKPRYRAVAADVARAAVAAVKRARAASRLPASKWAQFETADDFAFPQRLLVACALSGLFVGLTALVIGVALRYAQYQIDGVFNDVELLQLAAADELRLQAARVGATADVISYAATGVTSLAQVSDQFVTAASGIPGVADLLSGFDSLAGIDYEDLRDRLKAAVLGAGVAAVVVAAALVALLWRSMLQTYRGNLLRMRRGDYFFVRGRFGAKAALGYAPLQVWHSWLAFVTLWSVLFAAFFAMAWPELWEYVLGLVDFEAILLGLLTVTLAVGVVQTLLLGRVATRGDTIRNRYLFTAFDAVLFTLNLGAGFAKTVARWTAAMVWSLAFFARLDVCQMPATVAWLDPGYHSYVSMCLHDHAHNNPIVVSLCSRLVVDMHRRRAQGQGMQLEALARRRRVIARYWLFLTLANNPQLVSERGYQRKARAISDVYNIVGGAGAAVAGLQHV